MDVLNASLSWKGKRVSDSKIGCLEYFTVPIVYIFALFFVLPDQ